ncbi:DUF4190 domain-containing protein [Microbacterium paraoxydans]|uniref:DUF4190 domain-containing protein n=1 Tax=Microbacterium paraoxydans TaxID=199592 RepID=A0A1H1MKA5_9MICO|nr:DUF4190 domain-containing protein [Microbacterium paraoxydans]SDR87281.1 protein of unknown function [Microbacterium paraoxydans]
MSDPRISGPSGEQPPALPSAPGSSPAYPGFPQTPPAHAAPQQYSPPQQYSAPQQYAAPQPYGAAPARPTSGLAITSLVCGIAGVVLFWAIVPMLASITAVITGHMALGQIRRTPGLGGRGMAIAGLILGYVMIGVLVFTIVSTIIGLVVFGAFTLPFVFAS